MQYTYTDKNTSPDLDGIHSGVSSSDMSDKSINYCRWDEALSELKIYFENELDTDDKNTLDTIVSNNS